MYYIFKFSIYEKFLSVKQLIIFFFEKQFIYFEEDIIIEKLQKKIDNM